MGDPNSRSTNHRARICGRDEVLRSDKRALALISRVRAEVERSLANEMEQQRLIPVRI